MIRIILLLLVAYPSLATDYYVSNTRASNGSGTEVSPWKDVGDIDWSTVALALASGPVNVYCSSRDIWTQASVVRPTAASSGKELRIVGDEKYTLDATGTATWLSESTGSRAVLTNNSAFQVGGFVMTNGVTFVTIAGFAIKRAYSAVGGEANPMTNINNIIVTNCLMFGDGALTSYGVAFVFGETGFHSVKVSHCVVSNTLLESIYLAHFNFVTNTATNCIVEYSTIIDTGLSGEGEIDLKPACAGAIVRYNTCYRRAGITSGASCGVVCGANNVQIYGNTFYNQSQGGDTDWGYGVYLQSEGAGTGAGQLVTNALIYNNLFYSNESAGIRILGTVTNLSGVKIFNNTFCYNGRFGLEVRASGKSVTVESLTNNLFLENSGNDISLQNSDCHLTAANYNLIYRVSGSPFDYQGAGKTWAQWQALGFDSSGVNANPIFGDGFSLGVGSPAIGAGADLLASFSEDVVRSPRFFPWDIGAYALFAPVNSPRPTPGVRGIRMKP